MNDNEVTRVKQPFECEQRKGRRRTSAYAVVQPRGDSPRAIAAARAIDRRLRGVRRTGRYPNHDSETRALIEHDRPVYVAVARRPGERCAEGAGVAHAAHARQPEHRRDEEHRRRDEEASVHTAEFKECAMQSFPLPGALRRNRLEFRAAPRAMPSDGVYEVSGNRVRSADDDAFDRRVALRYPRFA